MRPPHGICVLAALILSCALAAGCGTSGPGTASASTPSGPRAASASASSPSPSPSATSPEAVCVKLVTHWAHEVLAGTAYGDYQSMGLSNGQYEILRDAVATARPVRDSQGPEAARRVIIRQVREGCAERYEDGGPSEGPWQ
ncbi:hypothetical protein [Streptomyces composti]|uniref:hypothetical protein n=1 Tax=Streptomyces composti TaxID=2720025 RepID=UPI00281205DB|nr:hypothetical protein [Streptomyces composti]